MPKRSAGMRCFVIFFLFVVGVAPQQRLEAGVSKAPERPLRLAFFLGGKTYVLFRAYIDGAFEREGLRVEFHSEYINKRGFHFLPPSHEGFRKLNWQDGKNAKFGKVTGLRIAEAIALGDFDGGTVGEASFVSAVSQGLPLVAVAALAHDVVGEPAKAIVLRKGLSVRGSEDLKGLTLISRRGGPWEAIMLREYLETAGLQAKRDLTVIDQVPEGRLEEMIRRGEADGGLFHVSTINRLLKEGSVRIHRRMDWMNPELSHGLLVFRKDFLESHPEKIEKFVRAYMARIRFEKSLPAVLRARGKSKGQRMDLRVGGLNLPQCDDPPRVRSALLREVQRLLLKHGSIDTVVELDDFIAPNFVSKIHRQSKK